MQPEMAAETTEMHKHWRGGNSNSPDSDVPEDLGDEGMAEGVDTFTCHTFTKEGQPQAMSELSYHQPI